MKKSVCIGYVIRRNNKASRGLGGFEDCCRAGSFLFEKEGILHYSINPRKAGIFNKRQVRYWQSYWKNNWPSCLKTFDFIPLVVK